MDMIRILILCVSAALICASIRTAHPQIAAAVALASGIAALLISAGELESISEVLSRIRKFGEYADEGNLHLLKLCGIAVLAEFASDICRDSGEASLANRIDSGVKIGVLAASLPSAMKLMERIGEIIQ